MIFLLIPIIFSAIAQYPRLYRWAFFPKRKPDFEHRLYVYWFDEKIAYSRLGNQTRMKLMDIDGILYEHFDNKALILLELFRGPPALDIEVQIAYRYHIHKKFEEIILE